MMKKGMIKRQFQEIVPINKRISLLNCACRSGNVSVFELTVIAALVRERHPLNLLEIGTFDGNTTLQMALHSPEHAIIHTLDLPSGILSTYNPLLDKDFQYIQDKAKGQKKYANTAVAHKIKEHLGDSGEFDFQRFVENRPLDFAFIDGSHSYGSVTSDTRNVLEILDKQGMILWHDFTPEWPGVEQYLSELAYLLPLVHIEETTLVFYDSRTNE